MTSKIRLVFICLLFVNFSTSVFAMGGSNQLGAQTPDYNPLNNAYFGDLHIHTRYSFDAFIFNTREDPDAAYRFGKGEAITHGMGHKIRLSNGPLDFMAVTDHAEYLGILPAMTDPEQAVAKLDISKQMISKDTAKAQAAFQKLANTLMNGQVREELDDKKVIGATWREIVDAADRHYDPGTFTTFAAYEWTSTPAGQNLHRNVVFRDTNVPDLPYSSLDSANPEDLWDWLDALRLEGIEALAIPHNSNASNGIMFMKTDWDGKPVDEAYATQRMRNEPIVEMTQVKGTSDTHPALSPNDEWADFEIFPTLIASNIPSKPAGSYVRDAYRTGLELQTSKGVNPYQFGMIGASDTHNAGGSFDETAYFGKVGIVDGSPQGRRATAKHNRLVDTTTADTPGAVLDAGHWGASGLAGVWARENTREAIYEAFRRKETFATSGPRMRVRFFAGYGFDTSLTNSDQILRNAYRNAVPMGGTFGKPWGGAPRFLVWAMRDPTSAWIDRVQIIKGWVVDGNTQEQVFDVACSDGREPDIATHRCEESGAKVNLKDCSYTQGVGASELRAFWKDPDFDPRQHAFYYVRVLENPTCRWSTWEANRLGTKPRKDLPLTIQERAWSSPIWYDPES